MKYLSLFITITFLTISPLFVFAQTPSTGSTQTTPTAPIKKIQNPLRGGVDTLDQLIVLVIDNIITPIAAVGVFLAIIYSGFKFVTAQGNPADIGKAKEGLLYVLIGAGIILGAKGISMAIKGTFDQLVNF